MSVAKVSRNRQRKAAYAALADKGSRNQDALTGPLIIHEDEDTPKREAQARAKSPGRGKVRRRPNPENMNEIGRCETRDSQAGRRCDLRKGHDGNHSPRPQGAQRKNGR